MNSSKEKTFYYQKHFKEFYDDPTIDKYITMYANGRVMVEVLLELRDETLNTNGEFCFMDNGKKIPFPFDRLRIKRFADIPKDVFEQFLTSFINDGVIILDEMTQIYKMANYDSYTGTETQYARIKREQRKKTSKQRGQNEDNVHQNVQDNVKHNNEDNVQQEYKSIETKSIENNSVEYRASFDHDIKWPDTWPDSLICAGKELIQFHYNGLDDETVKTYNSFCGYTKIFVKKRIFNDVLEYVDLNQKIKEIAPTGKNPDFSAAIKLTSERVKDQLRQNKKISNLTNYIMDALEKNLNRIKNGNVHDEEESKDTQSNYGSQQTYITDEELDELPFLGDEEVDYPKSEIQRQIEKKLEKEKLPF